LGWVGVGEESVETLKNFFAFTDRISPAFGLSFPKVFFPFGDCGE
jgi:hypothetical protein